MKEDNQKVELYDIPLPAVGTIWQEDDERVVRFVRIVCIVGERAQIEKVAWHDEEHYWFPVKTRVSFAKLERFGKKRGYKAVGKRLGEA